jgi:uncharacterized protein (TIGR02569 family)
MDNASLAPVLAAFNLSGEPSMLPGGTTQTFRVGDAVLKHIHESSLENNHSPALAAWIAGFSASLPQVGFRLAQPLATRDGAFITPDGWTASAYLAGQHAQAADIPACIQAITALHQAIAGIEKHPLMDDNRTAWGFAHRACWGDPPYDQRPGSIQPQLRPLLDSLYALRQPIPTAAWQLMHGDLNLSNLLVAPGQPPAILDFSPFWGPPEFALAIFANFSGPRRRDMAVLRYFENIPHFDQLLLRAAIRMLLVVAALDGLDGWEQAEEKWAAEQVL